MVLWFKYIPLLRVLLAYIAGVWATDFLELPIWGFIGSALLFIGYLFWFLKAPSYRWGAVSGWLVLLFFFLFGNQYALLFRHVEVEKNGRMEAIGYAVEFTGETLKNAKSEWMVDLILPGSDTLIKQKGVVYVPLKWRDSLVYTGVRYQVVLNVMPFPTSNHLNGFDYGSYLLRNGYTFVALLEEVRPLLHMDKVRTMSVVMANWRKQVIASFDEAGIEANNLGLITAFFLGDKSLLDPDLKEAFLKSGTIHLLAVSGMHVAILYVVFNFFLGFLVGKGWRIARFVLLIVLLWLYGLLTGMSPSVFRAVWMMSLVETARTFGRESSLMNTLVVALLAILMIDPNAIYAVGLWLSFGAVAGIVCFYQPLALLVHFKFPPFRFLWQMIAVTLAAQIGTLPLTLYYFHSFPIYFLFNNLVLVPLSMPVLLLCAAILVVPSPTVLSSVVAGLLNDLLEFTDVFVKYAETLPFAVWRYIPFDTVDLILWFEVIGIFAYALYDPAYKWVRWMLALFVLIGIKGWVAEGISKQRKELVVLNIKNGVAVQWTAHGESILWCSDSATFHGVERNMAGYWSLKGVGKPVFKTLKDPLLFVFDSVNYGVISSAQTFQAVNRDVLPEVCVIGGSFSPPDVILHGAMKKVVLPPIVSRWHAKEWEKAAVGTKIDVIWVDGSDYVHKIK